MILGEEVFRAAQEVRTDSFGQELRQDRLVVGRLEIEV